MSVLVTGGAGFIGSHLVHSLLSRGTAVRVLDNFATGTYENLAAALDEDPGRLRSLIGDMPGKLVRVHERCEVLAGDICDPSAVGAAARGIEIVFHQAALRAVPRSIKDPAATHTVNATGTLRVLEAARAAGVKRMVNASSSSVYGDTPLPKHEGQIPQPRSPYAASKLAAEAYCQAYSRVFDVETVSLRYFNVFGPRQDPQSEYAAVVPKFITLALRGEALPIEGDGRQSRDFTFIGNVVDANLLAAEATLDGPAVLNVGSGGRASILDLVRHLEEILKHRLETRHLPARVGDVRDTQADVTLARKILGYVPKVDFAEGLRLTVEAFRKAEVSARRVV